MCVRDVKKRWKFMSQIDKVKFFEKELSWIKNSLIRDFTRTCIENLPDYFFSVAASSSGKYHPPYALGEGGLVRHTKAAVTFGAELLYLEMYSKFSRDEKDLILAALILHDGYKHGLGDMGATIFGHPVVCAEELSKMDYSKYMSAEDFEKLAGCISSHMGQWNTPYRGQERPLPKPETPMQKFVHQCDYLASRKEFDFNPEMVDIRS
jgi:hypothetical protein